MIKQIEIGLTSNCNLKCPLCTRNKKIFKTLPKFKPENLDLDKLKEFISFVRPKEVKLVGAVGEPTLYPKFYELLKFLKENKISIWLSTNGVTHNEKWWYKIREVIPQNSTINLDIDHTDPNKQLYRRGTNLDKLKKHLKILSETPNKEFTVRAQRIEFDWNSDNLSFFKKEVLNWGFDSVYEIPCYDFNEKEFDEDLSFWKHPKTDKYKLLQKITRISKSKQNHNIECESKKINLIYLNYLGEVMPCCYINDLVLQKENIIANIYENTYKELIENYYNIVNNPLKSEYKNTCIQFCSKLNKQMCEEFKLDP